MNRTAVDDGLQQAVVQMIRPGIDGTRCLSCVTQFLSYARIQKIGAGYELSEQSEPCRIVARQFGDELSGWTSTGGGDQALESVRHIRTERKHSIETIARHTSVARRRKPFARRNQHVGEFGEHGTFLGIKIHTGTFCARRCSTRRSAHHSASAAIVAVGFMPLEVGQMLPS